MIKRIINDLIDDDKSLVSPLLKTKVLATRLKNQNLLDWVNKEINGYTIEEDVPNYRIGKGNSSCTIRQGYAVQNNTPVPVSLLSDERLQKFFYQFEFRESVKTLESYMNNKNQDTLGREFPIDFWAFITRDVRKSGFKGEIRDVRVFTHISSVTQTLTEVRNKFLDLMLSLESENPELPNTFEEFDNQTKERLTEKINLFMGDNYNITNSGDGSTVNTGNNSQINSTSGSHIQQEVNFNEQTVEILKNLVNQINEVAPQLEISDEDKSDIQAETERISTQLERENPKLNIIGQSLNTVYDIMASITANALTNPVLQGIQNVLANLG
jgi:hypothetical protein